MSETHPTRRGEPGGGGMLVEDEVFSERLRELITESRLSLQDIVKELRERGTPVTLATLSYWQTGRSRPERANSLAAVASLEDIFHLDRGSLSSLFPERKPRGRSAHSTVRVSRNLVVPQVELLDEMRAELGLSLRDGLRRVSVHDRLRIGPDRVSASMRTRQVFQATREKADRFLLVLSSPEGEVPPSPDLGDMLNCSMGRCVVDEEAGLMVVEVLLDRELAHGECTMVEHEVQWNTGDAMGSFHERGFPTPVSEHVLEVIFQSDDLPAAVMGYTVAGTLDGQLPDDAQLLPLRNCIAQQIVHPSSGVTGIRWSWGRSLEEVRADG